MHQAYLVIECPAMPIYFDGIGHKRTGTENCKVTIALCCGAQIVIENAIIPETEIVRLHERLWQVQECTLTGTNAAGDSIVLNLPLEDVKVNLVKGIAMAAAMNASGSIFLADGSAGAAAVKFPECPTNIFSRPETAAALVAAGTVTFGDPPQSPAA
jgi:hypothetical protein